MQPRENNLKTLNLQSVPSRTKDLEPLLTEAGTHYAAGDGVLEPDPQDTHRVLLWLHVFVQGVK